MLVRGLVAFTIVIIAFLAFVATREGKFHYVRSGVIQATPAEIFPYISDFRLGEKWSPFHQADPTMRVSFTGDMGQVGALMEFEGNKDTGAGKLELLEVVPNQYVKIKLTMLKPFYAENIVEYSLTPEAGGTRFSWAMSGDGGFVGKLINLFIDCEKMIGDQFNTGIENLKNYVEYHKTAGGRPGQ